jgi:hypothetical protein
LLSLGGHKLTRPDAWQAEVKLMLAQAEVLDCLHEDNGSRDGAICSASAYFELAFKVERQK